jgi:hypothetical protein
MSREIQIDIANTPELARIAEEVRATNTPRVLSRNSEPIAVIVPFRGRSVAKQPSEADVAATMSAAGSWADVDADALKRHLKAGRSDHRPPRRL